MELPSIAGYLPVDKDGDGWIIDDATGLNLVDDLTPSVPDPWGWAVQKWDWYIEKVEENAPGIAAASVAVGITTATAATVVGTGIVAFGAYTLYLLAYSPNVRRGIVALDPASVIKAGNPFK